MVRLDTNSQNPQKRNIERAREILEDGGLVIYPTDTVYGLGCDLFNKKAVEKIYRIKGSDKRKLLSFICPDLKNIAQYAHVSTPAYKIMRHLTPGPYTFILMATRLIPKVLLERRKTVGIRVPDNKICQDLLQVFNRPIISTSACPPDTSYINDPEALCDLFQNQADLFLDSGYGGTEPSTVIDLTEDQPVILREGKGPLDF
ncbi:threonylcarbamoyl-AMP synthase [candidate division KSB1 bacterium]|nr:threonylcarbamoyl-AMP synthase [candidate division KSB1 bacterium]